MAATSKPTYRVAIVNPVAEQHVVVDLHGHEFGPRAGLEGPFRHRDGRVLYYDAMEGRFYDPLRDMYLDVDDPATYNPSEIDEPTGAALEAFVRSFGSRNVNWDGFATRTMMFFGEDSDDPSRELFQRMLEGGAAEPAGRNRSGESIYRLTPAAKQELVRRGVWFASHGESAAPRQTNPTRQRAMITNPVTRAAKSRLLR